jgi:hypothetical protein
MTRASDELEFELFRDLETLEARFDDEEFSSELYRALSNTAWRKPSAFEGHVSLSWKRAEEIGNELRARRGREPLAPGADGRRGRGLAGRRRGARRPGLAVGGARHRLS